MNWELLGDNIRPRRIHVLVSSMSARGRAISVGPSVVRILREGGWEVSVSVTTAEDTPRKVAAAAEAPFVAALGGDGYLSQVAQGLASTDSIFVPLPGGRGNDLCRALGASPDALRRARDLASLGVQRCEADGGLDSSDPIEQRLREVDAMWVDQDGRESRIVLGILSVGYEAAVNQIANDSWFRSGPLAYGYGALAAFSCYEQHEFRAIVDGEERDLSGWVASVSNSGMFGGGIHFVPSSSLEDGRMELVHVPPAQRSVVLRALMDILKRREATHPLIQVSSIESISFTEPCGLQAWADGDPIATVPFTVRIEKGAIRMLV